ncbi:MAG: ATP-binding protein [Kiloniellales bacterium]
MTPYSGFSGELPGRRSLIKRYLPRSLLGRSLLIIVMPLILTQVIATWVFYDRHYDTITKRLTQGVAGDIGMLLQVMGDDPRAVEESGALQRAARTMSLDEVSLEMGALLDRVTEEPGSSILEQKLFDALDERLIFPFHIDSRYGEGKVLIQVQLPDRVLRVVLAQKRLFSSTTYIFIIWMVGSSIVLFGVATLFMRNQVRPIWRLAQAAENFGKGRDVPDFKPEGADEVRQAAGAFLQMRERIRRTIAQRTEMLAGVSHDLRTPLTRMKLQLAMLGDTPEAASLASDVAEMERMVEGYLTFARGEGAELPRPTDLGALLHEVVDQLSHDETPVDLHSEDALVLPLRPSGMRRSLTNLVANAQRHGSQVAIRAGRRGRLIEITIDDDGPGIPADKREEVFKPFFRLDQSRNPETGGTGLGLTIARDVVRSHGGDILLEDAPGGGLRARVRLPM